MAASGRGSLWVGPGHPEIHRSFRRVTKHIHVAKLVQRAVLPPNHETGVEAELASQPQEDGAAGKIARAMMFDVAKAYPPTHEALSRDRLLLVVGQAELSEEIPEVSVDLGTSLLADDLKLRLLRLWVHP